MTQAVSTAVTQCRGCRRATAAARIPATTANAASPGWSGPSGISAPNTSHLQCRVGVELDDAEVDHLVAEILHLGDVEHFETQR